mmetsp:Transcript_21477/g.60461  ORF Transcript_21477/g.60461 Transcript_21477/m.60461 type:complete len:305 (-) Transcript_21477:1068-1982(-)
MYEAGLPHEVEWLNVHHDALRLPQRVEHSPVAVLDFVVHLHQGAQGRRELEVHGEEEITPIGKESNSHCLVGAVPVRRVEGEVDGVGSVRAGHSACDEPEQGHVQRHAVVCRVPSDGFDRAGLEADAMAVALADVLEDATAQRGACGHVPPVERVEEPPLQLLERRGELRELRLRPAPLLVVEQQQVLHKWQVAVPVGVGMEHADAQEAHHGCLAVVLLAPPHRRAEGAEVVERRAARRGHLVADPQLVRALEPEPHHGAGVERHEEERGEAVRRPSPAAARGAHERAPLARSGVHVHEVGPAA